MYIPKSFQVTDPEVLAAFIRTHSFATLVSTGEGTPLATHLPLLLDQSAGPQGVLLGHVARANPHWQAFDGQQEALAIFHGPQPISRPAGTPPARRCPPGTMPQYTCTESRG